MVVLQNPFKKGDNVHKYLVYIMVLAFIWIIATGCSTKTPEIAPQAKEEASPGDKVGSEISNTQDNSIKMQTEEEINNQKPLPKEKMIDVVILKQKPELYNGCEVTSLAMLLQYAGHEVDKMTLFEQVKKDPTPLVVKGSDIIEWGDPEFGFVGDMTGKKKGFGIYNKPLEELTRQYLGDRTVNLTGKSFDTILQSVADDKPVVVWATGDFTKPTEWVSWEKDGKEITVPFDEHVVLIVGYDETHIYINNPLNGKKQQKVTREAMMLSWEAMGKQAITYT